MGSGTQHAGRGSRGHVLSVPGYGGCRDCHGQGPVMWGALAWGRSLSPAMDLGPGRSHSNFMNLVFITNDTEMIDCVPFIPIKSDPLCRFFWKEWELCQGGWRTNEWQEMLVLVKFRNPVSPEKQNQRDVFFVFKNYFY